MLKQNIYNMQSQQQPQQQQKVRQSSSHHHNHNNYINLPDSMYQTISPKPVSSKSAKHLNKTTSYINPKYPYAHSNNQNGHKSNNLLIPDGIPKIRHKSISATSHKKPAKSFLTARSVQSTSTTSDSDSGAGSHDSRHQHENRHRSAHTSSQASQVQQPQQQQQSEKLTSSSKSRNTSSVRIQSPATIEKKLNDYRNKIYMLEIELENERKKGSIERELRQKTIFELKSRYDTEKNAALKALEARINAEKLEEFNKLKESLEYEKINEIEVFCKNKDTDVFNMKMKLREKTERIGKLESIIKEERYKSNQTHKKSFEVIEKYSLEIKALRSKVNSTNATAAAAAVSNANNTAKSEKVTQTTEQYQHQQQPHKSSHDLISKSSQTDDTEIVDNYRSILEMIKGLHRKCRTTDNEDSNVQNIIKDIDSYLSQLYQEHVQLSEELKQISEAKSKLEVLYKVKCKSDLDKSATIKKLKLNFEMELMKFRNEENCDLVNHLEKQLNMKEIQLMEQTFELDSWRSADNTLASTFGGTLTNSGGAYGCTNASGVTSSGIGHDTSLNSFSQSIKQNGLSSTKKTVPIDIIFSSDPDVVTSTNCRNMTTNEVDHKNCTKKNRELQDKIYNLEKQLLIFRNMKETNKDPMKLNDADTSQSNVKQLENEKNNQIAEIQRLKAKLNNYAMQITTTNADLIKQNSYNQNSKELEKLLKQSNKEKLLLEREFTNFKQNQLKTITKDINETYTVSSTSSSITPTGNLYQQQLQHTNISSSTSTPHQSPQLNNRLNSINTNKQQQQSQQRDIHSYSSHQPQQKQQSSRQYSPSPPLSTSTTILSATTTTAAANTNPASNNINTTSSASSSNTSSNTTPQLQLQSQKQQQQMDTIDPLIYSALQDTNNALKIELARLAQFEQKCKTLEDKAEYAKELKEQNDKLEKDLQRLSKYKQKCEQLENDLDQMKKSKQYDDERQQSSSEHELRQARKLINDKDSKIIDMEKYIEGQKAKLRTMETELNEHKGKDVKLQEQKLQSIEQANRILEEELNLIKKQTQNEKTNLNELNLRLNDENKKLNQKLNELHSKYMDLNEHYNKLKLNADAKLEQYECIIKQQNIDIENNKNQFDKLKEQKASLENGSSQYEAKISELQKNLNDKQIEYENLEGIYRTDVGKLESTLIRINQENQSLSEEYNNFNKILKAKENELNELRSHETNTNDSYVKLKHDFSELQMILENERVDHRHVIDKQTAEYRFSLDALTQRLNDQLLKYDCAIKENNQLKSELSLFEEKFLNYENELMNKKQEQHSVNKQDYQKLVENCEFLQQKVKLFDEKCAFMQNENTLKEQENLNLIKLLDTEQYKMSTLTKQLDDIQQKNLHLSNELNETKQRLCVLESNLRDANDKNRQMEINNETTSYDLKKKQDELRKLQTIHETIKKEHMDTIELLEEKLRDLEKKTELQSIKHEEVMLELESIRAKRERTVPICPNCSTQTIQYYQSPSSHHTTTNSTTTTPSSYHQLSCMKNVEIQTAPISHLSQIESMSTNEIKEFLELTKNKTKTLNKEVNTEQTRTKDESTATTSTVKDKIEKSTQSDVQGKIETGSDPIDLYICKYAYNPKSSSPNENPELELELKAGEYLFVLNQPDDDGFFMGQLLDGKRGLVPSNFIEKVQNLNKESYQQILTRSLTGKFEETNNKPVKPKQPVAEQPSSSASTYQNEFSPESSQDVSKQSLNKSFTNTQPSNSQHPYPLNLNIDRKSETSSLIVTWDAPSTTPPPQDTQIEYSYQVYLNQELYCFIKSNLRRVAVIEKVDLKVPNRVSVQAISQKGASKPQECTILYGPAIHYPPTNLKVYNITQTTAIVSWWPCASTMGHTITINSTENRCLKAGIYRFKLSGLVPDTLHNITITSDVPNGKSSSFSANIEFTTLAIPVPTNVRLQKASNSSSDLYTLLWQPVINSTPTTEQQQSSASLIAGYAIYLDGVMVHQILDPTASMINLNTKQLSKGASYVTIRTISSTDGSPESKDSDKILLSSYNNATSHSSATANDNLEMSGQYVMTKPKERGVENRSLSNNEQASGGVQMKQRSGESAITATTSGGGNVTRTKKHRIEHQNSSDSQSSKSTQNEKPALKPTKINKQKSNEMTFQESDAYFTDQSQSTTSKTEKVKTKNGSKQSNKPTKQASTTKERIFIALFSYDPYTMSPNIETCHEELPFQEGQLIKVFGDQDADGFYYGESQGKAGLIPCNMISEVQLDDPYILQQLLNETSVPSVQATATATTNKNEKVYSNSKTTNEYGYTDDRYTNSKSKNVIQNNFLLMIALYDYDPHSLSPNPDLDTELSFKTGDIIAIYGDMDDDGFYMGELNGKRGLVPSNFLQEYHSTEQQNIKYSMKTSEPIKIRTRRMLITDL